MTDFTKEFIAEARESITEPGVERYICIPVQLEMLDEIERLQSRIAELEDQLEDWTNNGWAEDYKARIAELEAEIDQLTAHDATERQDDKSPNDTQTQAIVYGKVCEACGGDGTLLLTDGYEGQVMATVKCIYCNGTGRVNKECEE